MKRAILVATGTLVGIGAVFGYTPRQTPSIAVPDLSTPTSDPTPVATSSSPQPTTSPTPAPTKAKAKAKAKVKATVAPTPKPTKAAPKPTVAPTPKPTPTKAAATTRTITGATIPNEFGNVQVAITVTSTGKMTGLNVLQYPNQDRRSAEISSRALPILKQEALTAQTADISTVSGASYTSDGFIRSLQSALTRAKK